MQMSPESGNDRSPSPESGEHVWLDPAKIAGFRQDTSGPGQIRSDPVILAGSRQDQLPDPVRLGRIPAILARSGRISSRIRSYPAGFRSCWPDPAGSVYGSGQIRPDPGRFLSMTGFRPDSAGIRRSCRMLPDSGGFPATGFRQPTVFRWSDSDAGIIPVT
jgi:hypothetical protein